MFKTSFSLMIIAGFICSLVALGGFTKPAKAVSIEIEPPNPSCLDLVVIHLRDTTWDGAFYDSLNTSFYGSVFEYRLWIHDFNLPTVGFPAFQTLDRADTVGFLPVGTYTIMVTQHVHFDYPPIDSLQDGSYVLEKQFSVTGPTGILEMTDTAPPSIFTLMRNYPNPFNSGTTISFDLEEPADVELSIYDILGRSVRRLASTVYPAGEHTVFFDGNDRSGHPLPSGVYFCRATAGRQSATRRMALIK